MFAYCNNNPVIHKDSQGTAVETVWDLISLGVSIAEVCVNPGDVWAWIGLAGDVIDVIVPCVGGLGETVRAAKSLKKADTVIEIAKATDFTDEAAELVKSLDRSSGFTKSNLKDGFNIHTGYKATPDFLKAGKETRKYTGIRPDYIDTKAKVIYELKPNNPRAIRQGVHQLQKYNRAIGGGYRLRLEVY